MTKTIILVSASLVIAFGAGCGSSSSPATNTGDNNTPDATSPANEAGMNPLVSPPAGKCPGIPCSTGESCCYNVLSMTGTCMPQGMSCNGTALGCSGPADCTDPQVCCVSAGSGFSLKCESSSDCNSGSAFSFQLCDMTHACPTGLNCMSSPFGQGSYCQNPDAGAFMFPTRDAGTGTTEAGAGDGGAATEDSGTTADSGTASDAASE